MQQALESFMFNYCQMEAEQPVFETFSLEQGGWNGMAAQSSNSLGTYDFHTNGGICRECYQIEADLTVVIDVSIPYVQQRLRTIIDRISIIGLIACGKIFT